MAGEFRIVVVDSTRSPAFSAILNLWRSESGTLGFMPRGGFEQAASKRTLFAAQQNEDFAGYVMCHVAQRGEVSIVHLCTAPSFRGKGVARVLFEDLKRRYAHCQGVRLRCRRDFTASRLWPRLGFVPIDEIPAKAADALLTIWRYELDTPPLLRMMSDARRSSVVPVVIDANVFLDLDEDGVGHDESHGLLADWLTEHVELHLTDEIFTEIDRQADPEKRATQRARAHRFPRVLRDSAREEAVLPSIKSLLPDDARPSTRSDARQLAMTVAANVTFFVTRDGTILDARQVLYDKFDLRVVSPYELILHFDEVHREYAYRPQRLFLGPDVRTFLPRPQDLERIADLVHIGQAQAEPRRHTLGRLRALLATPTTTSGVCIEQGDELLVAYFVDRSMSEVLRVPYFGATPTTIGITAARHYAEHLVALAAQEGRHLIQVGAVGDRAAEALENVGFSFEGNAWVKVALPVTGTAAELAEAVTGIGARHAIATSFAGRLATRLRRTHFAALQGTEMLDLERALWPAKITSDELPCYIVPIRPAWAKELFDIDLAKGTLFGADPKLVMSFENVYYRAATPRVLRAPARILWYVSQDRSYPGSMAIRACSYADDVQVARPKELFGRFKRLGVYGWHDILGLANGDLERDVMAIRFSGTETMPNPVGWASLQRVLRKHTSKGSQVQGPVCVPEACYLELYDLGMNGDRHAA